MKLLYLIAALAIIAKLAGWLAVSWGWILIPTAVVVTIHVFSFILLMAIGLALFS